MSESRSTLLTKTLTTIFVVLLLVLIETTLAFKFDDCASNEHPDAKLIDIKIDSCPNAEGPSCVLNRGTNASIKIDFETSSAFSQAQVSIKARLGSIFIPFHLKPSEACGNYGFDCPVQAGQKAQLHIALPVLRVYPQLSPYVRLQLTDEKKNPIICVGFPAKLK